ncbi:MAG TPA: PepSY domain-containing protein [Gemmatimonadales bacterium]|jgi:uncharacterized membrane protein YkoI
MRSIGIATFAALMTFGLGRAVAQQPAAPPAGKPAATAKQSKVSEEVARRTALAKVPNGRVETAELEHEHGRQVYSFDITVPAEAGVTEVQVDAATGAVVSVTHETPAQEAKEKAGDRRRH